MRRVLPVVAVGLAVAAIAQLPAGAQVRPIYDRGAAGLTQTLERRGVHDDGLCAGGRQHGRHARGFRQETLEAQVAAVKTAGELLRTSRSAVDEQHWHARIGE